ncbi:MAG: tRNA (adenosine(37)-N6)-threonylcarbamoyltransferase complex dimerization subunit type 1 TsaB [Desulfobacterales bacterium]|nr:MAG: tRNA (adenosine(37)-N6)-threonylcarbamoyltransferase complex dimerization subunit type 1 TsaB [Desulfobacterales bacterium]
MKILAVDTATKSCSAAVIDRRELLAELTTGNGRTHSRHLMNIIDTVIGMAGLNLEQLDGFATSIGPGSFTGLRIGISAIKGLAYALNKPVVGISSLDALAWQCNQTPFLICAVIDARKKEVYSCRYRFVNQAVIKEGSEQVASPTDTVRGIEEPCIFVGNGALLYQELISAELGELAVFADDARHIIRASTIARLSLSRIKQKPIEDVRLLVPQYIRKSDAELKLGCRG